MKTIAYFLIAFGMCGLCSFQFAHGTSIIFELVIYGILLAMVTIGGLIVKTYQ